MTMDRQRGFTLIELLVVVTIIVVLLALLTPALDKAVYQAQLAVCGARLKVVGGATLLYAADNKRRYFHRPTDSTGTRPMDINATFYSTINLDDRPLLGKSMALNATLNCPLTEEVDIAGSKPTTEVFSSYVLWFGFRYKLPEEKGMYRQGDRFTYQGDAFNLLASDWDASYGGGGASRMDSHPDYDSVTVPWVLQDTDMATNQQIGATMATWSFWASGAGKRGLLDTNHAFDDGAVQRYGGVAWGDDEERMTLLPQYRSASAVPNAFFQVPR